MPNMIGAKGYTGRRARLKLAAAAATSLLASCAGGSSPSSSVPVASETQWATLERPRVERLAEDSAALDLRLVEADEALARVARLRAGGTLGGSEP